MKVTVYSGPACYKCDLTKKQLDKLGVPYTEVVLAEHPELVEQFKAEGRAALPVVKVVYDDGRVELWNDYRYARIKELATCHR